MTNESVLSMNFSPALNSQLLSAIIQEGISPLYVAAERDTVNAMEALIQHGASVSQPAEVSHLRRYALGIYHPMIMPLCVLYVLG